MMNGFCSIVQFILCYWKFDHMNILKMPGLRVPQAARCGSAPKALKLMEVLSLALMDFEIGPEKEQIMFGNAYK